MSIGSLAARSTTEPTAVTIFVTSIAAAPNRSLYPLPSGHRLAVQNLFRSVALAVNSS
jgi:hypothetical protein